ncbi:TR10A factor, partial [Eurystomus gularis]|nr:TR10A factor [Eurystomus gularis]
DFYQVQNTNLWCRKCPAEHCKEQNGSSSCSRCNENEYIEYPNDFPRCLGCQKCREDQVELSPCRADRNTQCICKNGTFCSPDHPCEMCQKCQPRCPKGEVELAPCTPHRDLQCGPPPPTSTSGSSNYQIMIGVGVLLVLIVLAIVCMCYCCRSSGDGRDLSGKPCTVMLTRFRRGGLGTQDNIRNEQFVRDQLLPGASGPEVHDPASLFHGARPRTLSFQVAPRKNLVPVQGRDPSKLLRNSFYIFAEVVPVRDWKRYVRALDLQENDIDLAEKNDKCSQESFFQMLNTWYNKQGMNASVNTLLETLHQINLRGVAEEISTKLVQRGFFQYEGS